MLIIFFVNKNEKNTYYRSSRFYRFSFGKSSLKNGYKVVGIDSIEESYGKQIKKHRILNLKKNRNFKFYKSSINKIEKIKEKVDLIIHLAAGRYVNHF